MPEYPYDQTLTYTSGMTTVTVPYCELRDGTGKGTVDLTPGSQAMQATQIYLCDWSNLSAFYYGIAYTAHPWIVGCYAINIQIEGWGEATGLYQWEQAKFTVGYKSLPFDPSNWKEVTFTATAEIASMDKNGVQFDNTDTPANKAVNESPQVVVPTVDCVITLHNQPGFPTKAACEALIGQVNTNAFSPDSDTTWAAFHVLYKGYDETVKYMFGGTKTYEISHKFTYAFNDWHDRYNPVTGMFEKVIDKTSGLYIFKDGDFSTMGIP